MGSGPPQHGYPCSKEQVTAYISSPWVHANCSHRMHPSKHAYLTLHDGLNNILLNRPNSHDIEVLSKGEVPPMDNYRIRGRGRNAQGEEPSYIAHRSCRERRLHGSAIYHSSMAMEPSDDGDLMAGKCAGNDRIPPGVHPLDGLEVAAGCGRSHGRSRCLLGMASR